MGIKKKELIELISEKSSVSKQNSLDVLTALEEIVFEVLTVEGEMKLLEMNLSIQTKSGRKGVCTFNKEPYETPDGFRLRVKPSKKFKQYLDNYRK